MVLRFIFMMIILKFTGFLYLEIGKILPILRNKFLGDDYQKNINLDLYNDNRVDGILIY